MNKRLTPADTPDDAQARLGRVDMQTGAVELLGEIIPLNVIAMEIDPCGQIFTAGFTLSIKSANCLATPISTALTARPALSTLIGDTGLERIMDMSFDPDGQLWGTTGNMLYTLDRKPARQPRWPKLPVPKMTLRSWDWLYQRRRPHGTTPYADGFYRIDPVIVWQPKWAATISLIAGGDIPMTPREVHCADTGS
ncbi:MAG: hypothetical protein R2911_10950 [Caldilineaceae bacterium]